MVRLRSRTLGMLGAGRPGMGGNIIPAAAQIASARIGAGKPKGRTCVVCHGRISRYADESDERCAVHQRAYVKAQLETNDPRLAVRAEPKEQHG